MELERIESSLRDGVRRAPRVDLGKALVRKASRVVVGLMPRARVPGVRISEVREGGARYRLYLPEERGGAGLVWVHGGGMVGGGPKQTDRLCAETARALGVVIASARYRFAPEHPFPAASDDCRAVWERVLVNARGWGVSPERITVGGQSAGGGLAAGLVQRVHDEGGVQPAGQWLVYPMLDDRTAARGELDAVGHFVWDNRANRFGWGAVLGVRPGADVVPEYAVPARRGDLTGLPPAWIGVGDVDLFHDEDVEYARRLRAAGVDVTLDVAPGAPHGFDGIVPDSPVTSDFLARARSWLGER
ncbi:alpha/beta hydrolase [Actinosynnema mirum]|uniref:Alpha/beta hydrolase fold-3 domain protein n=1 Tax=Actinosynnema mirum (strain ATCC 29888 / DSM 43827 / JCM 3225 / NBRC 14064 / NCIMB 13271 / NRRL B-12336 / IMRU 3971 / 101) TaxID=446462 RepID=C6WAY8_ACTMD|nr:alpha/beta hydrolase [Actinosynnema mirum]ACU37457.1 Alpha/beta hydrolase fold-3 domain protein [Actinosynnema mirum DSM 43827]